MFKQSEIFYPNKTYFSLDFEKVKSRLMSLSNESQDFGSILVLKENDYWISVNNRGKVEFFYDQLSENLKVISITNIENIFRDIVDDFRIVH